MKQLLVLVFSFVTFFSFAQEFDKEVLSSVSKDVCNCLDTKEYSEDTEGVKYIQKCMLEGISNNLEYLEENKIDLIGDNEKAGRFGEKLGMDLAVNCPKALPLLMLLGQEMIQNGEIDLEDEEVTQDLPFIIGKITDVEKGTFPVFKVVDIDGRKHNILWLTIIDNPVLFEDALKGKKNFILEYYENELYDARIKEYRNMKVLNAVKTQ